MSCIINDVLIQCLLVRNHAERSACQATLSVQTPHQICTWANNNEQPSHNDRTTTDHNELARNGIYFFCLGLLLHEQNKLRNNNKGDCRSRANFDLWHVNVFKCLRHKNARRSHPSWAGARACSRHLRDASNRSSNTTVRYQLRACHVTYDVAH